MVTFEPHKKEKRRTISARRNFWITDFRTWKWSCAVSS